MRELLRYRIGKRVNFTLETLCEFVGVNVRRCRDQYESSDSLWRLCGNVLRNETAHRVPDDRRLFDLHRIHERDYVARKFAHRITARGALRIAVPALVQHVNAMLPVEQRQHPAK